MHFLSHYPDFLITSCSQCTLHSWMGDVQSIVLHGLSQTNIMCLVWDSPTGPTSRQAGMLWGRQPFCLHFSLVGAIWIHGSGIISSHLMLMLTILDCCLLFLPFQGCKWQIRRGMARSSIGWWVAAVIGRFCHSYANSILWCIVKATKAIPDLIFRHSLAWLWPNCQV